MENDLLEQSQAINHELKSNSKQIHSTAGMNRKLFLAICAIVFGSAFQHGYNTPVFNNAKNIFSEWITDIISSENGTLSEIEINQRVINIFSWITSIFCVGGMVGGLSVGFFADSFGRKGSLFINLIFVLIAVILECGSKTFASYIMLCAGRFFIGVNSGLNAGIVPMYVSEITPVKSRGAVGSVYQLVVTISILISTVLGMNYFLATAELWPYLLAFTAIPAILQLFLLPLCPESPKYLMINNKESKAQKSLSWYRNGADIVNEFNEMVTENEGQKNSSTVTYLELFTNPILRTPLIIVLVIMSAQQLSGINAVFFFCNDIFKQAGLSDKAAEIATVSVSVINVLMTFVSMVLVDKAGRKTLLLVGFGGMCIVSCILAILMGHTAGNIVVSWICVLMVVLFVILFACGPGSIPWFLVSELFNDSAKGKATSLAVGINWFCNFLVGRFFLVIAEMLQGQVFFVFFGILIVVILFIMKYVPETKNKTVEEITAGFRTKSY
uniref:Major facilitator superfamily (MFS) profile domain-containing protein n=1 Tax=Cuerna arida TaxID=1464854 RepID=A0A1B6GGI3_9HEMI